ncbi:MAG: Gfo/Idh/MocA family oxidoreductase [Kiritimatiellae bacterium]|nr:Gfo/Idh/MocA family oxidoreductase [Kiritimatiellia bacterium]
MKIGFVGVGKQAQCMHIPAYASLPDVELAAVADLDAELGARVAARFAIPRVYASHTEMLRSETLDALVLTLPGLPFVHPVVRDILTTKIPVMMEKPLSYSVDAARRLVDTAETCGTHVRIGFHKRSDPATMYAKALITDFQKTGDFGAMRFVRIHLGAGGNWSSNGYLLALQGKPYDAAKKSVPWPSSEFAGLSAAAEKLFHGINGGLGHQLDLLRHLLGHPYAIQYADRSAVLVAAESETGIPAALECVPYQTPNEWEEYALVAFERAYVKITLPPPLAINRAGTVEVFRNYGNDRTERMSPVFPPRSAMQVQADNFMRSLRGEPTPLCTISEACDAVVLARDLAMKLRP